VSSQAGLPDGIFSNQKSQFGKIFEGLGMEKVGIFSGRLKYIMAIWCILWLLGNVCFQPFWYIMSRKIWQPCSQGIL
jgi:hypothetical protein